MESGELLRYICCKTSLNSPFLTLDLFQLFFQELTRIACSASGYFFRSTYRYNVPTFISTFRAEVNHIIGTFDNIHIMFDDDNAVSPSDECVEGIQQFADVVKCSPVVGSSKINRVGSAFS